MSGNAEAIELVQEMQKQQLEASQAIIDSVKKSWDEAEERSGTVGAVAMVGTGAALAVVGDKAIGAVARGAGKVGDAARAARRSHNTQPVGGNGITIRGKTKHRKPDFSKSTPEDIHLARTPGVTRKQIAAREKMVTVFAEETGVPAYKLKNMLD